MRPAPLAYHRARTVRHATELLAEQPGARVLAGGQSLMPRINARLDRPAHLVDITRIPDLDIPKLLPDGHLAVPAAVRHRQLCTPLVAAALPLTAEAARLIGPAAVRAQGTVVGSIAFADPAAELPATVALLGGRIHLASVDGERTLAAGDFLATPARQRLAPHEVITQVDIRLPARDSGAALTEFSSRHGDRALAGAAAMVRLARSRVLREVRLCLWSTTPEPLVLDLVPPLAGLGRPETAAGWLPLLTPLLDGLEPPALTDASSGYRHRLALTAAGRALHAAAQRAAPPCPGARR